MIEKPNDMLLHSLNSGKTTSLDIKEAKEKARLQAKVTHGFDQLDRGEYSNKSVKDIFNDAKEYKKSL